MFDFKWFLTTPGILTGLGCLLILISIVIFISSMIGKKNKKEGNEPIVSEAIPDVNSTNLESNVAETPSTTVAPVEVAPVAVEPTVAPVGVAPVAVEPTVAPVEVTPVAVEPAVAPVGVTPVASEPTVAPVEVTPVAVEPTVVPTNNPSTFSGINIEPTIEPVPTNVETGVEINPQDLVKKDDIEAL